MSIQDLTFRTTEISIFKITITVICVIVYLIVHYKIMSTILKEVPTKIKIFILIAPIVLTFIIGFDIYNNIYHPQYFIKYKQVEIKVNKETYTKLKIKLVNTKKPTNNSEIQEKELKEFIKKSE